MKTFVRIRTATVGGGPSALVCLLGFLLAAGLALAARAEEGLAARTVVLVNSRQPESVALGEFYRTQRGIPEANVVALPMPEDETITWRSFVSEVWQPLQDELLQRGWLQGTIGPPLDPAGRKQARFTGHRLAYLVLCRGTPLRISHDPTLAAEALVHKLPEQLRTNQGAVDSELSLLAVGNYDPNALIPNPLFSHETLIDPRAALVVKVARLDGPSFAAARSLVTSALTAERQGLLGRYYVDLHGPHPDGDRWLEATRVLLDKLGFDGAVEDTGNTFEAAARFDAPVLYFGWYTDNLNGPFAREGFVFPPGAIALHIHSFSAQTLRSPTAGWCGPLAARGVAATFGNVFEPYLQFTERPDLLLQALVRGATLGDAAYFALPVLSWQDVVIGDPLYRPFQVSVEEQRRRLVDLPEELAPYAVMRAVRLLDQEGQSEEARGVLLAGLSRHPSLALVLFQAQRSAQAHDDAGVEEKLQFLAHLPSYRAADWPMIREAAELLAKSGASGTALAVYAALAQTPAPTPASRRALLTEAREAADAAGDQVRSAEFAQQLQVLDAPPAPAKP